MTKGGLRDLFRIGEASKMVKNYVASALYLIPIPSKSQYMKLDAILPA